MDEKNNPDARYIRQVTFAELGEGGQAALEAGRVLVVGAGGLGSWMIELLARAGVGMLRIVDDDRVDWTNLHRQAMYDEAHAAARTPKAAAAAARVGRINSHCRVEAVEARVTAANVAPLAADADVILDATDNFATRFLLNDVAVKAGKPWVFTGAVRAEGQTMTILPGRTPCLRCLYEDPPPPDREVRAATHGVLGPAVAALASVAACEAVKLLAGAATGGLLLRVDLWTGAVRSLDLSNARRADCPCCGERNFHFFERAPAK